MKKNHIFDLIKIMVDITLIVLLVFHLKDKKEVNE